MTWANGPFLGFDLETTGTDPLTARIVTAAFAYWGDSLSNQQEFLIDAGEEIPEAATAIHGISTDDVRKHGTRIDVALPKIMECIQGADGAPLVLCNAAYDLTVLNWELARADFDPFMPSAVIDVLVLDRYVDKYRKGKRTLTALCQHYGVKQGEAHTAGGDAMSAMRVAWTIGQRYPEIGSLDLDELYALQVTAHAEWAENYQTYLRGSGKPDAVIDATWPVRA